MPMGKGLEEKAAELNRMLQALCLRNPGVRALCPKATAFKNELCSGVLVYTLEGSPRIYSRGRAAKSANKFWIATTLKYKAAE